MRTAPIARLSCGESRLKVVLLLRQVPFSGSVELAPGVELVVRPEGAPPTPSQLRALASAASQILEGERVE